MRFHFVGGLDVPDWLLSQMFVVSKMSVVKFKVLCKHVVQQASGGAVDVQKLAKLLGDAKLDSYEVKGVVAALQFILSSSARYDVSEETLALELQQLGLPKEHTEALVESGISWPLALVLAALATVLLFSWLWPSSLLSELDERTVAAERARLWRLILPPEALDFGDPVPSTPSPTGNRRSSLVERMRDRVRDSVSEALTHHQPQAWQHQWTYRPSAEAARDRTPLLVFINRGSGGRQGEATLVHLQALLSPQQVVDLSSGNAEQALQSFRSVGRFRVLVCGGDGTVGWVLSLLDGASLEYTPPVAILPLGTGNDLARALGWGGGHPGRGFVPLLEDVDSAQVALLDRWSVSFEDARVPRSVRDVLSSTPGAASSSRLSSRGSGKTLITAPEFGGGGNRPARSVIMQNYLGVGVDANVALEWHQRRQSAPKQFTNVFKNKLQYIRYAARQMLWATKDFNDMIANLTIVADGVPLTIPPGTKGIIVLNIASYAGGSDLWGAEEPDVANLWNATGAGPPDTAAAPATSRNGAVSASSSSGPSRTASTDHLAQAAGLRDGWKEARPRPIRLGTAAARAPRPSSRQNSLDSSDNSADDLSTASGDADEWDRRLGVGAAVGGLSCASYCHSRHRRSASNGSEGGSTSRTRSYSEPPRHGTPPSGFVTASMDDQLLEVVAIEGVLHLGLAQLVNGTAHRLCQCSSITITQGGTARLPMQVDGEPFELEPIFAPKKPMSITISHRNQAVMLSRSQVRSDGVALEAIDWAMQEGVITVDQRNQVVREIARRTGSLQRRAVSMQNFGSLAGSYTSLPSLERTW